MHPVMITQALFVDPGSAPGINPGLTETGCRPRYRATLQATGDGLEHLMKSDGANIAPD